MTGFTIERLNVAYGKRQVLHDLNMEPVARGSLVALLGANAVGKSTLLKSMAGLKHASGKVWLNGLELLSMPTAERVQNVGYLPQSLPQSTSLLVWEALCSGYRALRPDLATKIVERDIQAVLERLGIIELALRPLSTLSGGQRQMVGLAQVLVRRPQLLLLDEPTSALDMRWQLRVLQLLHDICRDTGAIAVIAIHDINLALRFCDWIAVLGCGRLLAAGPARETISAGLLRDAFDIEARVENCSLGWPMVITDGAQKRADADPLHQTPLAFGQQTSTAPRQAAPRSPRKSREGRRREAVTES
jgi:iron complex transport system ATP-binding protein